MKKLLIFILLLVIPTIEARGYYCDYTDVAKYKKIASNINYSYEYEEKKNKVTFHVTLVNLSPDLYLKGSNSKIYNYTSNELVVDAKSGESLLFYVYPTDTFCDGKSIYTIRIQLPTYNKYYSDEVCKGVESYNLCNKWSTHKFSYEDFKKNVLDYKASLQKEQPVQMEENDVGILYYIVEFVLNYYYIILPIVAFISYIVYSIRSRKDNIYS